MEDQTRFVDSLAVAKSLVLEAGLGLAPGDAFVAGHVLPPRADSQGWLRWCFASQDLKRLGQGAQRLEHWLGL